MIPVGALRAHPPHIEAFDNVQRLQGGDTLPIGRTLPAGDAPVVGGDRLIPVGAVARQVFVGQPSALFLDEGRHLLSNFPLVKGLGASLRYGPQRIAQSRNGHQLPMFWGTTVD